MISFLLFCMSYNLFRNSGRLRGYPKQGKADCTADYKLQQLTQQWMDEAVVETTQAYDELDVKLFYQNLTAQTEARAAAVESAAPAQSTAPAESGAPEESSVPTEGQ